MAYSKVILNSETLMDVTTDTVTSNAMLSGTTATKNDGTKITGSLANKTSSDLTVSGATVTVPAGCYTSNASKSVSTMTLPEFTSSTSAGTFINGLQGTTTVKYLNIPQGYNDTARHYQISAQSGTAGTPTATKGTVSNHAVNVTPSVTNTTGYITGSTKTGTAVSVSASELVSGTKSITSNGTGIDVTNYASVDVSVSGGGGGGIEYETGIWTPSSDVASYVISFTNTHTEAPFFYMISDSTGTYSDVLNSNYATVYYNSHQLTGMEIYGSTTSYWYGSVHIIVRTSSPTSFTDAFFSLTTPYTSSSSSSTSNSRYWATETGIKAISNSTSRLWRAGRAYNWIAVWTPTT